MKLSIKRILLWTPVVIVAAFAVLVAVNWEMVQRIFLGGVKVYETTPPKLPDQIARPAILVFSKTNGFRHEEAIPAANAVFAGFAKDNNWGHFQTENGATFDPAILSRFDAVVFNNVSGDVFTPKQRQALKDFISNGGGFVGIHGAGGDMSYDWKWYVDTVIGAQFIGHPMDPQFQKATVRVADKSHPAMAELPEAWDRTDEWYSFEKSPRKPGVNILATLDESTYSPKGMFGQDLVMGKDHPIIWWHCVGKGRVLYSALGHTAASYSEENYKTLLKGAVGWAVARDGKACDSAVIPVAKVAN